MIPDAYLTLTSQYFPRFSSGQIVVEPLEKGGSGRKYHRLGAEDGSSLIFVKYTDQREENRHFCDIAEFLHELGIAVPKIFRHDPADGLIWVEDLGAIDLWSYRNEPWRIRHALYISTLEQVVRIHTRGHRALDKCASERPSVIPSFQNAFDAALYRWEQNYFFEQCAGRHFGVDHTSIAGEIVHPLEEIAERLAALPRVLVHRDFQSQNIMIREHAHACLIDFQGMRPGLGAYDLASLLYDPYVPLSTEERDILKSDYKRLCAEAAAPVPVDFDAIYDLCAAQRLMQALGAYGYLGHATGQTHFLRHIPTALNSLHEVTGQIPSLRPLQEWIGTLQRQS